MFLKNDFSRAVLNAQRNWAQSTGGSCIPAAPHMKSLPKYHHPHQSDAFVSTGEFTLTQYCPKSIACIILFYCSVFYGFGQMYNDTYPPLWYDIEQFHCPENPLSPLAPRNWRSFYRLHSLDFSRMSNSWNRIVCSLFRLA